MADPVYEINISIYLFKNASSDIDDPYDIKIFFINDSKHYYHFAGHLGKEPNPRFILFIKSLLLVSDFFNSFLD